MNKFLQILWIVSGFMLTFNAAAELIRNDDLPLIFYIILLTLGCYLLIRGSLAFRAKKQWKRGVRISLIAILMTYCLAEITINALVWTKTINPTPPTINLGFGYFNGPCASYDSTRGYRWNPGEHREVKMLNNTIIYDQVFSVNNAGIYAQNSYLPAKKKASTRRYIVLGDSFTAAEYLAYPWHERINSWAVESGEDIELYSFALNGGGLTNWHRTFFQEIIPKYEFDGLILAIFGNDLHRKFFVMHHTEHEGLTGYLDVFPSNEKELIEKHRQELKPYAPFMPDVALDEELKQIRDIQSVRFNIKPGTYAAKVLIAMPFIFSERKRMNTFLRPLLTDEQSHYQVEGLLIKEELSQLHLLNNMLSYCRANDKEVLISTLPYKDALPYYKQGMELITYKHAEAFAMAFDYKYIDASKAYIPMSSKSIKSNFLDYDIHWNQKGSDRFAREVYKQLTHTK